MNALRTALVHSPSDLLVGNALLDSSSALDHAFHVRVASSANARKTEAKTFTLNQLGDLDAFVVGQKQEAPAFSPVTLVADAKGRARWKDGEGNVEAVTAIVLDIDFGNVSEDALEEALESQGLAAAYWPTWQSGSALGLRWRVVLPLDAPIAARMADAFKKTVVRKMEAALRRAQGDVLGSMLRDHPEEMAGAPGIGHDTFCDWRSNPCSGLHFLPAMAAAGTKDAKYTWGGIVPRVMVVEGKLLRAGKAAAGLVSQAKVSGDAKASPLTPLGTPLVGDAERGRDLVSRLGDGLAGDVHLLPAAALDAVAAIRVVGVPQRGPKGSRHNTCVASLWHLHRFGFPLTEIEQAADDIGRATALADRRYVEGELASFYTELAKQERSVAPLVDEIVEAVIRAGKLRKDWKPAVAQYARILMRNKDARGETGASLDHMFVQRLLGFKDYAAMCAMRRAFETAGFLCSTGTKHHTRWFFARRTKESPNA